MTSGRDVRTCAVLAIALMFIALSAFGPTAATGRTGTGDGAEGATTSRSDEPIVFVNATNSSGMGWGYRPRTAWGDYDTDGYDDVLFGGWELWRNNHDGTFVRSPASDILGTAGSRGGVWGDYNNDGYPDIYQIHGAEGDDRLFKNNGDGTFTDVTGYAGEISDRNLPSEGAAWADYDRDGYLDIYVANYEWPENSANGTQDILYHNNGDGTFTNATTSAGIGPEVMCGRGVVWADYDDDGWPDIYVSNYRLNPNFLWKNNGNGTFTNVAPALGLDGDGALDSWGHSIGSDWGDMDNDGDLDLFVANLAHPRFIAFSDISKLYINSGPPDYTFQDVPIQTRGIAYEETHSNPAFADHDNDGDLDLFITSVYDGRYTFLYRNDGNGRFTDVTDETRAVTDNGWGAAWSDYDMDGFMDLVVGSGNSTKFRLFNNGGNGNHWFRAELRGVTSNSLGIGARVEIEYNGTRQVREVTAGKGTTSQDMVGAHFGLGAWSGPVDVTIRWPSGILQKVDGVTVDQDKVFIEPPPRTEFGIVSVNYTGADANNSVLQGTTVTFSATIENRGTVKGDAEIELSVAGFGIAASAPLIKGLAPFENGTYMINWSTAGLQGSKTLTLAVVRASPEDTDLSNNEWRHGFFVNERPEAAINLIDPPVAYQGKDTVEFRGTGTDDGQIVDYQWTSDLDGLLSNLANFTMTASELSTGVHEITFRVKDDRGVWSLDANRTLMIEPPIENKRPDARIIRIEPSPAKQGEPVEFEGEGSDPDGYVDAYRWESSIDGVIGDTRKFTSTDLSAGTHEISLVTIDDKGLESKPATSELLVKPENLVPKAYIEIMEPNPAEEGEKVRFQGRGVDDDGSIASFVWTSSIDGVFSYDYDFSYSDLSVGVHTIGLKVKDDSGAWSPEVFADLEIVAINERPTINITGVEKRSDGVLRLKGTAEDKDGGVVLVQVLIGSGVWMNAMPLQADWSTWYFDIKPKELDLAPGDHMVYARSFDGTDYSDDESRMVKVEAEPSGVAAIQKMVTDAFTGNNWPCLMGILFVTVITVLVVWNALTGPRNKDGPGSVARPSAGYKPKARKAKKRSG